MQTEGVNDRVQLATLRAELNRRTLDTLMRAGVTIVDPNTTWVDAPSRSRRTSPCCRTPSCTARPRSPPAPTIGPDTTLTDVQVGEGATIIRDPRLRRGDRRRSASVGPFAYLRPGTTLGVKGKIGTFVETKNAAIADGAKVPHLTYAGDATIGEGANIGAGTIFANYDGVNKHHSTVGRHSFVGSNSVLVAPADDRRRRVRRGRVGADRGVGAGRDRGRPRAAAQHQGLGRAQAGRHEDREGGRRSLATDGRSRTNAAPRQRPGDTGEKA